MELQVHFTFVYFVNTHNLQFLSATETKQIEHYEARTGLASPTRKKPLALAKFRCIFNSRSINLIILTKDSK
jgi:hypothetical protein